MSVTAAIMLNVALDFAIVAIIAHVMAFPRRLTPHFGSRSDEGVVDVIWPREAAPLDRAA
jgi:hypothetical protein